jgi:hypothetical protein
MGILDSLFGGGEGYQAQKYDIDKSAYSDPDAAQQQQKWSNAITASQNQAAPTMTAAQSQGTNAMGAQLGNGDQRNAQVQSGLMSQLQSQANGQGPSVAQANFHAANDANMRQQLSLAASGGDSALGQRQAALNAANGQQANAQALVGARAQEQLNAQNQLGSLSTNARGQDLTKASDNANLGQSSNQFNASLGQNNNQYNATAQNSASQANMNAGLQQQQINNQNGQYYSGLANNRSLADVGNQIKYQQDAANNSNTYNQLQSNNYNTAQAKTGILGSALSGAASMAANYFTGGAAGALSGAMNAAGGASGASSASAAGNSAGGQNGGLGYDMGASALQYTSDKNAKTDIKKSDNIADLLGNLTAYDYNYKDPSADGSGERTSVMAQDLEKSKLGSQMVVEKDGKKVVDYSKSLPALLAAVAEQHKEIASLKSQVKGK